MTNDPESTPFHSQLPEFVAERFHLFEGEGSYDMLQVRCPRSDCGESFWVSPGVWEAGKSLKYGTKTRSCPYCFKSAWLPGLKPRRPRPDTRTPHMKIADREGGMRSSAVKGGVARRGSHVVRRRK